MKRNAALATLRVNEAELKTLGVERLYLFGSVARDEARADSHDAWGFASGFT
jgi:predicted nucleotidyltransferase